MLLFQCPLNEQEIMWREAEHRGKTLYTAAYYDDWGGQDTYFLAQGGRGGQMDLQGIFWYHSKRQAKAALEMVVGSYVPLQYSST